MPTAYLLPNGRTQFFNPLTGTFLSGGSVYTYAAGTSTPQNTWADGNQVTVNANPITLDAYGSASIFWNGDYKVSVFDSLSNLVYTQDNIATTALTAGQIPGTSTNDNASAGNVGELIVATAGLSLSNGVAANVATISLTAGDWYVWGNASFVPSVNAADIFTCGINTVSATLPTSPQFSQVFTTTVGTNAATVAAVPQRISVGSTTPVYLVIEANFASGTCSGTGTISGERRR